MNPNGLEPVEELNTVNPNYTEEDYLSSLDLSIDFDPYTLSYVLGGKPKQPIDLPAEKAKKEVERVFTLLVESESSLREAERYVTLSLIHGQQIWALFTAEMKHKLARNGRRREKIQTMVRTQLLLNNRPEQGVEFGMRY